MNLKADINKNIVVDAVKSSLKAFCPSQKVSDSLIYDLSADVLTVCGRAVPLNGGKVFIYGTGKCVNEMALGIYSVLGKRIESGILLSYRPAVIGGRIFILKSSHPLPCIDTLINSKRLLESALSAGCGDLLIFLVSGGGSSFFEIPLPGVEFDELIVLNKAMLKSAIPISEMNIVRKALSAVKGGKFLSNLKCRVITLAISDTAGSNPADIASGPSWPCDINYADPLRILKKYNIHVPAGIVSFLEKNVRAARTEYGANAGLKSMFYEVIADNASYLNTIAGILKKRFNIEIYVMKEFLTADKNAVEYYYKTLLDIKKKRGNALIFIAGGEVPIQVKNPAGRGGRCQHFALEFMKLLKFSEDIYKNLVFAAFATDGLESFTDAAGACFDESDVKLCDANELILYIENNNSYDFCEKNGLLIKTGVTGLNVNDVYISLIF